jgi:hypothetical protein
MKNNRKWLKVSLTTIILVLIFSSVVFAVNASKNSEDSIAVKKIYIDANGNKSEVKESFEDVRSKQDAEIKEIMDEKRLSKEQISQLYDKGYGMNDIDMAQRLSLLSDKTAEQIFQIEVLQ